MAAVVRADYAMKMGSGRFKRAAGSESFVDSAADRMSRGKGSGIVVGGGGGDEASLIREAVQAGVESRLD